MDQFTGPAGSVTVDRRRAVQMSVVGAGIAGAGIAGVPKRVRSARAGTTPVATPVASPVASPVAGGDVPISGDAVPQLAGFDQLIPELMLKWDLPGGQVAIAREGRLVYDRGFGYASVEDGEVVEPGHRFRIASNSKPLTMVGILRLIDAGLLSLDTPVFPLLKLEPPANAPRDPRLDTITVEHLLVHSGGWNTAASGYDPQYLPWPLLASHLLGAEVPARAETIVRFMLSQPLDFDPGTLSAYSNFGYNVLGRVIEHVSGQEYEAFMLDEVINPSGITSMAIAGTTLEERLDGEVRYYSPPGLAFETSVYPGEGFVPAGYGSYDMRSLDAHGGWISSASDLVRFLLAVDGTRGDALLTEATVTAMETTSRPPSAAIGAGNVETSFGLGFNSVPMDGGYEWSHSGALVGSNCSWFTRRPDRTALGLVFNSLPEDYPAFFPELFSAFNDALEGMTDWPEGDLFA